ncbi:hypothetical protein L2E82_00101 [Cichorium intybus]|uniref:Uncharacterized protein n=1 Tax=Cichorium intybus TaxID=13427 RepID=A0ACB9GWY4_CICIN|nr:hypothetical protein L2E82_00101 [Cichorium intybus]
MAVPSTTGSDNLTSEDEVAMLVHPDKNMGDEKDAEAFKKLQNGYEVYAGGGRVGVKNIQGFELMKFEHQLKAREGSFILLEEGRIQPRQNICANLWIRM